MSHEDMLDVARRIARAIDVSDRDMVLVTGSVARGLSDQSSDIDVYVYRAPDADSTGSLQTSLAPTGATLVFGVPTATGRFEKYRHDDRYIDVEQVGSPALDDIADRIQTGTVEPSDIKVIVGMRDAIAVTGAEMLTSWHERLALTDRVAAAEVGRLGSRMLSPRALWDLTWARSDELSYFTRVSPVLLAGLGLLGAANRQWVSIEDPKWMPWQIERLRLRPPGLIEGFRAALTHPTERSTDAAGGLLVDILDLVDEHIDGADTRAARFALGLDSTPHGPDTQSNR